jgi:hypothetical protein
MTISGKKIINLDERHQNINNAINIEKEIPEVVG